MRVELQPAFVLHTRPYRDTSMLVDLLTQDFGRMAVIAKGVRRGKSNRRALLNPFNALLVSFQGKGGLKLLTGIEQGAGSFRLQGASLYSGFYLNELLVRLLAEQDPQERIYRLYCATLEALAADAELEPLLRQFEFGLLAELGYGLDVGIDTDSTPVIEGRWYRLNIEEGLSAVAPGETRVANQHCYPGSELKAIASGDFSRPETRSFAKRLTRSMLKPLLGDKPLKSRDLFSRFK